jgi:protein-L-isoaspartate(D-aspartate) O-methyltransferase
MVTLRPVNIDTSQSTNVDVLRERLIGTLRGLDALRTSAVENAFRAVPRHVFLPELPLEEAYAAEGGLVTKRDGEGVALSSVSAPRIQAFMLEQARIGAGMRVLEIGSGGVNAALIWELVGAAGEVTSIDIDPEVIERARRLLDEAGYTTVRAVVADGTDGEPKHAPYDRIVVTHEAPELAPAWVDQLTEGGRIVVPLRLRGLTRSAAFHREDGDPNSSADNYLVARELEVCGFVPMQGAGAKPQQTVVLHDGEVEGEQVSLRLDGGTVDAQRLREAFTGPRTEAWSGVTMSPGMSYEYLDLWLATVLDDYALLATTRQARDRGLVTSWSPMGISTLIEAGDSFAYFAMRPTSPARELFEFGAVAHGPHAADAADRFITEIRAWDRHHRDQRPEVRTYPASTPDDVLPAGRVLEGAGSRTFHLGPSRGCRPRQ